VRCWAGFCGGVWGFRGGEQGRFNHRHLLAAEARHAGGAARPRLEVVRHGPEQEQGERLARGHQAVERLLEVVVVVGRAAVDNGDAGECFPTGPVMARMVGLFSPQLSDIVADGAP
jgi:hypothetical protein